MSNIRTAAQREADARDMVMQDEAQFVDGAVWGAARVTPTREQIVQIIDEHAEATDGINPYETAAAILALMVGLAEGES